MKNWLLRIFLGQFSSNTNFFQSKVGKIENVVISERVNTILETISFQGNKIWPI
jgi:hypothetical protein